MSVNKERISLSPEERKSFWDLVILEMDEFGVLNDWVHGPAHIARVEKYFFKMVKFCPCLTEGGMARKLHAAVLLHDIFRGVPDGFDHAEEAAKFLEYSSHLSDFSPEDKRDIIFAIRYHNKGLKQFGIEKAIEGKYILCQLLIILDGLDALGEDGVLRIYEWYLNKERSNTLYGDLSIEDLENIMSGKLNFEDFDLKSRFAVLPHFVFELCFSGTVIKPVMHWLTEPFIQWHYLMREEIEREINRIIRNQRRNNFEWNCKQISER